MLYLLLWNYFLSPVATHGNKHNIINDLTHAPPVRTGSFLLFLSLSPSSSFSMSPHYYLLLHRIVYLLAIDYWE
jgi:hypothetical protein